MSKLTTAAARQRSWELPLLLLTIIWAGATLWFFSDGALSVYVDMVMLYLGAALLGTGAIVTLVAGSASRRGARPTGPQRWLPLAVAGIIMAAVPGMCRYGIPFSLRFALSERALSAAVEDMPNTNTPRWIGLFQVQQVDHAGGAARLTTGACGLAARCGIAHEAKGRPQPVEGASYKALSGPWWLFEQR